MSTISRDTYVHGLVHVVSMLREQNELLMVRNQALESECQEMRKYCHSISGLGDTVTTLLHRIETEESKSSDIADSLIMLWGQLAANDYVCDKRQVSLPRKTAKKPLMLPIDLCADETELETPINAPLTQLGLSSPVEESLTSLWS